MSIWDVITFDMSREGLVELTMVLEPVFGGLSEELQNFANEIRAMAQKAPAVKEESWLDG